MPADETPGDIYQSTEGVYLDYANEKIPTFRNHLRLNPYYVTMGTKMPLGLGHLAKSTQATALDTEVEAFRAAMHNRYETAVTVLNGFSASLREVEKIHREAEDDSDRIGGALIDEFSEILTPKGK
ncbi:MULTISPECIES: hypothetical protein [Streptomyces]|uniref:hypothetical protein n=1 Tax=Streptomyces TaxID=1883 RepID=UPI0004BFE739|nr:hypothetical protein [Streptomyces sp. NRRL B-1381]